MESNRLISKPLSVIFLGIDGMFIGDRGSTSLSNKIEAKVQELFERKQGLNGGFSELEWRIAASHFFSKPALYEFECLIERIRQVTDVALVITSGWGKDGTVEDLRERMFATCFFSKLIIDKTPDWQKGIDKINHARISKQKYGFDLNIRGRQIDYWIRENYEKLNIQNIVILDSGDCVEIFERYPQHTVIVSKLLSNADCEKAFQILTQSTFSPEKFPLEETVKERIREKELKFRETARMIYGLAYNRQ